MFSGGIEFLKYHVRELRHKALGQFSKRSKTFVLE
jgi:hypothetical protein